MQARVPGPTYRLQFHAGFTFDDAAAIVPYLSRLGIAEVYASPILKARAGSLHGYDIVDHNTLNPELGGEDAFLRLSDALRSHGMGLIVDIVPNHMGIGQADNAWWLDVLEWGRSSPYATYFDIDWTPAKPALRDKVLVPVLGDHYGAVLEAGDLNLAFDPAEGSFSAWFYEHRFPIMPALYAPLLKAAVHEAEKAPIPDEALAELDLLASSFRDLRRTARTARARTLRRTKGAALKERLAALVAAAPRIGALIEAATGRFHGAALHRILEAQNYRLAFWRVAADEINYRRFFQINDLAGLRVEEPEVFDATHALILRLVGDGHITGLRIDHIDGLFAPRRYLHRLQDKVRAVTGGDTPFPVLVEKILGHHEGLREGWPVTGTTGYEYMNAVNGVFIDQTGEKTLDRLYRRVLGAPPTDFNDVVHACKRLVMAQELAAELRVLSNEMDRVLEQDWHTRDFTTANLHIALREVVAAFPVYRTYVNRQGASAEDLRDIDWAIGRARRGRATADPSIYDVVRDILTTDLARTPSRRRLLTEVVRLARKFQQYTGPVMAKGVEDTAFYRYNRLVSLNEVGGHPSEFGLSVAAFHRQNADRARRAPLAMLATATHDHKRGEDTRARITALSEVAADWDRRVRRWMTLNRRARRVVDDAPAPHPNDEYLIYQMLVGIWPVDGDTSPERLGSLAERLSAYMMKALREAKERTSWTSQEPAYEQAVEHFIGRILDGTRTNPFLDDLAAFHAAVAPAGMLNGLGQIVLKHVSPGQPDTYQGTELWDDSMVDPDNRRPVDYDLRTAMLDRLGTPSPEMAARLLDQWHDGALKLHVLRSLLHHRKAVPELFGPGAYLPLEVEGRRADTLIALARQVGDHWLIALVPRLTQRLPTDAGPWPLGEASWGRTRLALPADAPAGPWSNLFTGETVTAGDGILMAADVFTTLPVAVLVKPVDA